MSRAERKSKRKKRDAGDAATSAEAPSTTEPTEEPSSPEITTREITTQPTDDQWPDHSWPANAGPRRSGFQVVVRRSALNAVHRHGQSTPDVEICGVLVGNVYRDQAGTFLLIDDIVRGDFAGSANSQVTFTAETWDHIQKAMEADHPDQKIVGWYHTHPGFGIFLSEMDLFIHGNFFNMPWQVAFVYDPVGGEEGIFLWENGKTERGAYAVEEDAEKEVLTVSVSPELTAAALADFSRRMQGMERRQKTLMVLVALIALIALAWPFVLFTVMSDQSSDSRSRIAARKSVDQESTTQPTVTTALPAPTTAPSLPVSEILWKLLRTTPAATQPMASPSADWRPPATALSSTSPSIQPATRPSVP